MYTCVLLLLLPNTHNEQLQAMALHLSRVLIRNADSTLQIKKSKASQTSSSGSTRKLHPVEVGDSPLTMSFNNWSGVLMQLKLARDKTEAAQIVALMQKAQFIRPALQHHHHAANNTGTIEWNLFETAHVTCMIKPAYVTLVIMHGVACQMLAHSTPFSHQGTVICMPIDINSC
jgi:hypothetical protein